MTSKYSGAVYYLHYIMLSNGFCYGRCILNVCDIKNEEKFTFLFKFIYSIMFPLHYCFVTVVRLTQGRNSRDPTKTELFTLANWSPG